MISQIDFDIGISVYSTDFEGCRGQIRVKAEDFQVFEVLSKKTTDSISPQGNYAVYKLKKSRIDTNHALSNIFNKYGLRLKALGLKDASAVTEQFVCSEKRISTIDYVSEKKYSLKKIGFVNKPLSKKNMIGNRFQIRIIDITENLEEFKEYEKILNFYGYQRFGSKRPVTHLIGKALLQKDYDKAVSLLLTFTSKYDSKKNSNLREKLHDRSKYSKLIEEIPHQMDLERIVVSEIIKNDNSKNAIRSIPLTIRRLFVQAYQSFLFNLTLSAAFNEDEDLFSPQQGDVCYDENGILGKYSHISSQRLSVPVIGYSYYKKTRFNYQISKILELEEINPKDFFQKDMQEISAEGGFRNSSIKCEDIKVNQNMIAFTLSRGSFATIVLREIMKPDDPLLAGF